MSTEKIEKIRNEVEAFNGICNEYTKLKLEIESLKKEQFERQKKLQEMKPVDQRKKELLREAWGMEIEETEADKVIKKVDEIEEKIQELQKRKDAIQEKILDMAITLPFPVNPDDVKKEERYYKIGMLEGLTLKNEAYKTLGEILDLGVPIKINKVIVESEAWKVEAKSLEDTLIETVNAIKTIREQVKFRKKVFSEVDAFCERVRRSDRYRQLMLLMAHQGRILPRDAAKKMGVEERVAYDTCYNLTRNSLWNPPLVKKDDDGHFSLTTFGSLVMQRYAEKYSLEESVEPGKQLNLWVKRNE